VDEEVLDASLLRRFEQSEQVAGVTVDAAVADEAHEVNGSAVSDGRPERRVDGVVRGKLAVSNSEIDAGDPLVDDEAGADVEMADLGVAHLAIGEADRFAGGAEGGVR